MLYHEKNRKQELTSGTRPTPLFTVSLRSKFPSRGVPFPRNRIHVQGESSRDTFEDLVSNHPCNIAVVPDSHTIVGKTRVSLNTTHRKETGRDV